MRTIRRITNLALMLILCSSVNAQELEGTAEDFARLKGETAVNIELVFDKLAVGDYAKEEEYVKKKTDEMNAKEAGTGDRWATEWYAARKDRYLPKFIESFTKYSGLTYDSTAKYSILFKTTFIEPGFQVVVKKKASQVEGQIWLAETANKTKKLATASVERGGGYFRGGAFDFATRIAEVYAVTGKKLGTLVKKGMK